MKIAMASDHGGYELKEFLAQYVKGLGYEVINLGTDSDESVDYPVFGKKCAEAVAGGEADCGIVCCGTGIGIAIAANKVKGIRCAVCATPEMAELAKRHNNANIISIGGRTTEKEIAKEIVDKWLGAEFEGGRHKRRTDMLDEM